MDSGYAAALPLALGAAVSPGLLAIVLLILSSEHRPKARAWFYLLGVVTVILVATLVGMVPLRALVEALGTPLTNWSTLLLYLSALEVIRATATSTAMTLLASCVAFLITIAPLLLPVMAVTLVGHRSDRLLALLGQFARRHSNQIIAGIYVVLAGLIAVSALNQWASQ